MKERSPERMYLEGMYLNYIVPKANGIIFGLDLLNHADLRIDKRNTDKDLYKRKLVTFL